MRVRSGTCGTWLARLGADLVDPTWLDRWEGSAEEAIASCPDWTWFADCVVAVALHPSKDAERRTLARWSAACARTALPYVPAGEARPLALLDAVETWAAGGADCREPAKTACSAAYADVVRAMTPAVRDGGSGLPREWGAFHPLESARHAIVAACSASAALLSQWAYAPIDAGMAVYYSAPDPTERAARIAAHHADVLAITRRELGPVVLDVFRKAAT